MTELNEIKLKKLEQDLFNLGKEIVKETITGPQSKHTVEISLYLFTRLIFILSAGIDHAEAEKKRVGIKE